MIDLIPMVDLDPLVPIDSTGQCIQLTLEIDLALIRILNMIEILTILIAASPVEIAQLLRIRI